MKFGNKVSFTGEVKEIGWTGLKEGVAKIDLEGKAIGEISFSISRDGISTSYLRVWGEKSRKAIIEKLPKAAQAQAEKQLPLQLAVPPETEAELKEYLAKAYEQRLEELKSQPIEIRFKQRTMHLDGELCILDEWRIDEYEIEIQLLKDLLLSKGILFGVDVTEKDLRNKLEKKGLLKKAVREVERETVVDYTAKLSYADLEELVYEFTKATEKELEKEIEEKVKLTPEEIVRKYMIGQVHVTEDGYFSDCEDTCDDCFWYSYLLKEVPEKYHKEARKLIVRNKEGKEYIYSLATPELIQKIAQDKELVEKFRNDRIAAIQRKLGRSRA